MRHFFTFFLIFCCSLVSTAQDGLSISGQVVDENNTAVPFANAALYNQSDSLLITGAVSDENGNFTIETKPGKYFLRITFLSYEEKLINSVLVDNKNISLGRVILKAGTQILESVTVQGEKSQMELYLDKRVFQVGKDLSNTSGNAAEILDNVPSVSVDVEGNISLRGSQNVRILIDGRPSGMTGISVADALRQLQGNLIESIEVITNPSARYDAEGEVGIINIILKKERDKGINGSFSVNGGYPDNYGASFNLNFRQKNLNLFSSYGISYRSNPGSGSSFQTFTIPEPISYRQNNVRNRSDVSHNFRLGADYYLNDKNILTGSFLIRRSDGLNKTTNEYIDYDVNNSITEMVTRKEREEEPELNTELALSYRKEFNKKDQLLTADFKWIENSEEEFASFEQSYMVKDSIGYERSENTENERNALLQIDYVHPFASKGKMEGGFKSTLRVIDNDFQVERQDASNSLWSALPQFNNHLIYTENIHAAYFIIGNEIDKFSWQTGLRAELADIKVELERDNEVNYQNYLNFFPSAHLSYKLRPDKTIQLSYSYRLSRPRFRDLMPFSNYSDNRAVRIGNPNLKPEYTNSIEAGYLINWESGSLLSNVYYRYRTGVVEQIPIPIQDNPGTTNWIPVNLATQNAYGLEFNFSWNPVKWWRFNSNANFYRAITEGFYEETDLYSDTYTWTNRTTSRITFLTKWDFQTGFNYRGPRITTQGEDKGVYFFDLGLSRDVLKGKGTLTFAVRDLFNSRKFRSVVTRPDEGYFSESENQWRRRQFVVTFSYRLNRKKDNSGPREETQQTENEGAAD